MKLKYIFFALIVLAIVYAATYLLLNMEIKKTLSVLNQSLSKPKADTVNIQKAVTTTNAFTRLFPYSGLSPSFLFEVALLYEKQQKYAEAIKMLDKVYLGYPHSKQASKAVFLEGFLYANVLNQLDKAKEKYQLYLDKYSAVDEKMTNDVKMELQNLGKNPEEILKEIQEKAAKDSTQAPS